MKQLDLDMDLPSPTVTFEDFDKLNSELNEFLKVEEGELIGPRVRQQTQDLDLLSHNNINSNPNLVDENSSVISIFDKTTNKYQIELAKELQKEIVFPKRQNEWVFNSVNDNLNRYLLKLGEEQLEPVIEKLKEEQILGLENMLSTLDLTPFVCSFVNSIANQYFFDVLYDNVLHSLSEKIPEEQIKLETNLRDFEQGFVEKVTKREVFIEALQESDFGSYFFNSKNCQDQIISIITQFIDEKDVWGAAVFLNKYLEVVRNHGNSFSEENELKLDDLKKRYKKELFPNVLLGISNEYRENYLTQLKKAEKEIRKIQNIQDLSATYFDNLFGFYPRDLETLCITDNGFNYNYQIRLKPITSVIAHFRERFEDLKQARENQLKRIQLLGPRKQNTIQTSSTTSNARIKVKVEPQKPKINLEELLKGATYTADIEEEDRVGKVILAYDTENNGFHLITRGIKEEGFYFIVNKDPKKFRDFTSTTAFSEVYGMHRQIKTPSEKSQILGGGAYFTEGNRIHIDYKSGDFGRMNLDLVKKFIENSGYQLTIMDEKYFNETPVISLLGYLNN